MGDINRALREKVGDQVRFRIVWEKTSVIHMKGGGRESSRISHSCCNPVMPVLTNSQREHFVYSFSKWE